MWRAARGAGKDFDASGHTRGPIVPISSSRSLNEANVDGPKHLLFDTKESRRGIDIC
jgi:hypothetical protein